MSDTLARLTEVFHDVFDDDDIVITRETTAADIDDWDSVMHINLMLKVEAAFGFRVSAADATGLKNVGQLIDMIDARKTR